MTIEELYDLLKSEFPKLNWHYHQYHPEGTMYIRAEHNGTKYRSYLGISRAKHNEGQQYISVAYDRTSSGCGIPTSTKESAMNYMRDFIKEYSPKLVEEEQQLTLF
jgi:hypothetical protein